ncbi:MAG: hypothetical protein M0Z58_04040 [Nitrospiraceae bacterium]|nr:hypothetical protein [Nitrospiraceae bacterium]
MRSSYRWIFLAVLAAMVLLAGRMAFRQAESFREGQRYFARGDWKPAIRQYDTAMHFYLPFSPIMEKSAERLWRIGRMFEAEGKPGWALIAYSSIRSSFYGVRSFYTPGRRWIERCDEKIASLDARMLVREGGIKPGEAALERQKYMAIFKDDRAPSVFWSAAAEAGFFGWAVSALASAFYGFEKSGRPRGKAALCGGLCFLFFAAVWAVSLLMA